MPLELVLGPANSAKAGEVLGAYAAAAPRGALLVVPTSVDARHYQRELTASGVVFGSVLTFPGLAREIARRVGYSASVLSDLQRDRVLEAVLARLRFQTLSTSSQAPGFRLAARELIAELQAALVTPARWEAALRNWAAADESRERYAADLGRLYQEYVGELERIGRVDRELYAWRALDALRAEPGGWGADAVYFYGFDDLTDLQRDAVETLSRIVGVAVTVSLTYEPGRTAMLARARAVQELMPLAERVRELPPLDVHYAAASRPALHHLERHLFESGAERIDPGTAVGLSEAGGERAEAELVAGRVLGLLRNGFAAGEIVVAVRSLRSVAALFENVFEQYGIALRSAVELPLRHTTLGRALRGAARSALDERGARPEDLLDYLRAPGVLAGYEIADRLEAEIRRQGLRTVAAARRRLGVALPELDALATTPEPGAELRRLADRLLVAAQRTDPRHTAARTDAAPLLSDARLVDARAVATFGRALDELGQLGVRIRGEELLDLIDELPVRAATWEGDDRVLLAEPLTIRARRFRAVFVCGLQEGGASAFPLAARPEPFLSDEHRRELAAGSGLHLHADGDPLDRERYLFYTAVSRATELVVLSYRSSDEEGNVELPSPFIADVADLFSDSLRERRSRRLLADVVWEPVAAPTARELARSLAAASAPSQGEQPEPDRALHAIALNRLRHTEILSAGALEAYADCPVKWLVERELRPQPLDPESDAIARGNLMHAALERVLSELGRSITADSLPDARQILDRVLAELVNAQPGAQGGDAAEVRLGAGRPAAVRAGGLRAIEADLRRYFELEAAAAGDWRPSGLELRFGFDDSRDSLPALELDADDQRVRIRGAIDRLDIDARGGAIVRDYKSGATRPSYAAARWAADRRLQVALYLIAVRELTGLAPAGGFYQPLRGDDLRPRGMFIADGDVSAWAVGSDSREPAEFAAELDAATVRAVTLAAALRSGALTPCPQTCSRDGCSFPGICRSQ
jgi:ATP-dependent helicase/DNAse subunit B